MVSQGLVFFCHLCSQIYRKNLSCQFVLQVTATFLDNYLQGLSRSVSLQYCETFLGMGKTSRNFSTPYWLSQPFLHYSFSWKALKDFSRILATSIGSIWGQKHTGTFCFQISIYLWASGHFQKRGTYTGHLLKKISQYPTSLPGASGLSGQSAMIAYGINIPIVCQSSGL